MVKDAEESFLVKKLNAFKYINNMISFVNHRISPRFALQPLIQFPGGNRDKDGTPTSENSGPKKK